MQELEKNELPKNEKYKFLNDIYDDFFYLISSNPDNFDPDKTNSVSNAEEQKSINISKANAESNLNTEKINVEEKKQETAVSLEDKKEKLNDIFTKISNSHLTPESQDILKKMIEYAGKYNDGIVKNYIPFNMRIYCDNDQSLYNIVNIIIEGFTYFNYIKNDTAVERSLFVVEESNHISDLYNKHNSIVIFKDSDGLLNKEINIKNKLLNVLETSILDYSNIDGITTIITDTNKQKIDELFSTNSTLRDKIFDFELYTTAESSQEVYQKILDSLRKDYILSADFEITLLDYVNETYNKTTLSAPEYINATIEKILFNKNEEAITSNTIPPFERNKSINEIFKDLNSLVGLKNVKTMLKDLVSLIQFKNKAGDDIKIKDTNLHMVFLGNPGTGKTTVARMIAEILYNLDYIEQNKLIEVSAKDLIGQYVGQTAPKTMSVIERALGGVLFIDEAYSLASKPGNTSSFNDECIATLIQAMENYRDNLVVIFAGYSKEMDAFLKSNSGIVSRIGYTMEFKDYTVNELITILKSMFEKSGFVINDDAIEKAKQIILEFKDTEGFGNARFVRNLYEKSVIKHASNVQNETSKEAIKTITANDINTEGLKKI